MSTTNANTVWQTAGSKQYELTNHLGNIMATITDRRVQVPESSTTFHQEADVANAQAYYAFGGVMPGLQATASGSSAYRYGFNGKENDNDISGTGNWQDYGQRMYNPQIGRFPSVDPIAASYPYYTPYQFSGNSPIEAVDLDGLEPAHTESGRAVIGRDGQLMRTPPQPKIKVIPAKVLIEQTVLMPDMYGNGHIGPRSVVVANIAAIKQEYRDAVSDNIRGGLGGTIGYYIGGDKGSFVGAAVDGVAMSTSSIKEPAFFGPRMEIEQFSVLKTNNIMFSQQSVTELSEIVSSMRSKGWAGPPIDVVELEGGKFGTLDNTRVLAAHEAGIDVEAIVHKQSDLLTPSEAERFTTKKGGTPKTWGDAYKNRIGKQNAAYKKANPNGSYTTSGSN